MSRTEVYRYLLSETIGLVYQSHLFVAQTIRTGFVLPVDSCLFQSFVLSFDVNTRFAEEQFNEGATRYSSPETTSSKTAKRYPSQANNTAATARVSHRLPMGREPIVRNVETHTL